MNNETIARLFDRCLAIDNSRYMITFPFRAASGEHIAATDGRICVRMPIDDALAIEAIASKIKGMDEASSPQPPIEQLWEDDIESWPVGQIPPPPTSKLSRCEICNGTGDTATRECDDCDGSGVDDCPECGHEHACKPCGGKGRIQGHEAAVCDVCLGTGVNPFIRTRVDCLGGAALFAERYLSTIRHAGIRQLHIKPDGKMARFADGSVEGVVMACRPTTMSIHDDNMPEHAARGSAHILEGRPIPSADA